MKIKEQYAWLIVSDCGKGINFWESAHKTNSVDQLEIYKTWKDAEIVLEIWKKNCCDTHRILRCKIGYEPWPTHGK